MPDKFPFLAVFIPSVASVVEATITANGGEGLVFPFGSGTKDYHAMMMAVAGLEQRLAWAWLSE